MINPIRLYKPEEIPKFIPVDDWIPSEEDNVFKHVQGCMILPISAYYGLENDNMDYFILSSKKGYNGEKMRNHFTHYLNYFLKFYDRENELLSIYCRMKYLIDIEEGYTKEALIYDLNRYIFSGMILYKVREMNRANYMQNLNGYRSPDPVLRYTNKHGMILMEISVLTKLIIPILTHFISIKKITKIKDFLLEVFDILLHLNADVDIYTKLYETTLSYVKKNESKNPNLWEKQAIRGRNTTTHSEYMLVEIITGIIPKYTYNQNMITLNFVAIKNNLEFVVTAIEYEYTFIPLSSSRRDEDNNSEFDKFESSMIKQDESLYIQNKVNCEKTMEFIEMKFGPFSDEEVQYYIKELGRDGKNIINDFQKNLIFAMFYKYFGETVSAKAINKEDYIKLMLAVRKILEANGMVSLPAILSSRIQRLATRTNINTKERIKLESSPYYPQMAAKYKNVKIEKDILQLIAIILASEFKYIDYYDQEITGATIPYQPEHIFEEILMYIILIN